MRQDAFANCRQRAGIIVQPVHGEKKKGLRANREGPFRNRFSGDGQRLVLDAEGTAATASALDVRIIEFEARAFETFHVVDGNTFQVHFAHLVD